MKEFYPVLTKNECGKYTWKFENNVLIVFYGNDDGMVFPSITTNDQLAMFMLGMSMYCYGFTLHGKNNLVQDCFPDLTTDEREYIINGITPEAWDELFDSMEVENELS